MTEALAAPRATARRRYLTTKVPEVTAVFWAVKILTTGLGEATSDYLAAHNRVVAVLATGLLLLAALVWQLRTTRYQPLAYWVTVAMVAIFGTMAADVAHVVLGIPYAVTTVGYALSLAVVLGWWWWSERTLSIHSILTPRRELFYWATVLATFALGTAAGDLTAYTLRWGYLPSAIFFGVAILVPLLAWRLGAREVAMFWTAYVLTRPLGASVADWLGKPAARAHGLGLGDGTVTVAGFAIFAVALVGLVAQSQSRRRKDT